MRPLIGKLNFCGYLISRFFSYSRNSRKFDAHEKYVFYSNCNVYCFGCTGKLTKNKGCSVALNDWTLLDVLWFQAHTRRYWHLWYVTEVLVINSSTVWSRNQWQFNSGTSGNISVIYSYFIWSFVTGTCHLSHICWLINWIHNLTAFTACNFTLPVHTYYSFTESNPCQNHYDYSCYVVSDNIGCFTLDESH